MLTRLNLKRGEGKLVDVEGSQEEPKKRRARLPQSPPPSSPPKEAEAILRMSHRKSMKNFIPKRKKECSGNHSLT